MSDVNDAVTEARVEAVQAEANVTMAVIEADAERSEEIQAANEAIAETIATEVETDDPEDEEITWLRDSLSNLQSEVQSLRRETAEKMELMSTKLLESATAIFQTAVAAMQPTLPASQIPETPEVPPASVVNAETLVPNEDVRPTRKRRKI